MAAFNVIDDPPSTSGEHGHYEVKELNYALVKSEYFRKIEENRETLDLGPPATRPFTKRLLKQLGRGLRNGQIQSNTYELLQESGNSDVVILKRNHPSGLIRRVVVAEDSFEIILGAHIATNHGSLAEVSSSIVHYNSVPICCIQYLLDSCNVCSKNRIPRSRIWHLSIAPLQETGLSKFGFILYYKDDSTNFILLKPLLKKNEEELSLELLKIFSQFGPPKELRLYGDEPLFKNVLSLLSNFSQFEFPVNNLTPVLIESDLMDIVKELTEWRTENKTNDWVIGCHIVQWKMNTTKKKIKNATSNKDMTGVPYELMFSSEANVFKNIRTTM